MNNPFPGVQIVGTAQGDLSRKKKQNLGWTGVSEPPLPLSLSLSLSGFFFALIFFCSLTARRTQLSKCPEQANDEYVCNAFLSFFFQFLVGFESQNPSFSLEKKIKHCSYCNNIEISS